MNEADPSQRDWKKALCGENYEKPKKISRVHGIRGIFYIHISELAAKIGMENTARLCYKVKGRQIGRYNNSTKKNIERKNQINQSDGQCHVKIKESSIIFLVPRHNVYLSGNLLFVIHLVSMLHSGLV